MGHRMKSSALGGAIAASLLAATASAEFNGINAYFSTDYTDGSGNDWEVWHVVAEFSEADDGVWVAGDSGDVLVPDIGPFSLSYGPDTDVLTDPLMEGTLAWRPANDVWGVAVDEHSTAMTIRGGTFLGGTIPGEEINTGPNGFLPDLFASNTVPAPDLGAGFADADEFFVSRWLPDSPENIAQWSDDTNSYAATIMQVAISPGGYFEGEIGLLSWDGAPWLGSGEWVELHGSFAVPSPGAATIAVFAAVCGLSSRRRA